MITRFREAMDDDLNTAAALAVVQETAHEMNLMLTAQQKERAGEYKSALLQMLDVLGLPKKRDEALAKLHKAPGEGGEAESKLIELISAVRAMARKEKAFAISDFIRERLADLGYEIRDLPDGKWEIKRRL